MITETKIMDGQSYINVEGQWYLAVGLHFKPRRAPMVKVGDRVTSPNPFVAKDTVQTVTGVRWEGHYMKRFYGMWRVAVEGYSGHDTAFTLAV